MQAIIEELARQAEGRPGAGGLQRDAGRLLAEVPEQKRAGARP